MAPIGIVAILLGLLAAACLVAVLSQLWAMGGQVEEPVGALHARRPDAPPPPAVPAHFRSLIGGESTLWGQPHLWNHLTTRLDQIEDRLGGTPGTNPPPEKYSAAWLEERIAQVEMTSGPLPSPMPPPVQTASAKRFWKRR